MRDKLNAVGFTQRCDLEDLGHSAGLSNIRYQGQQPRIDHIAAVREGLTPTDCEPNQSTSGDELIEQKQLLCRCERAGRPLSRVKICGADALRRSQSARSGHPMEFLGDVEMEALLLDLLQHRAVLPEFARDASYAERDELLLRRPLGVLNSALNGRDYLTDSSFTVADLNVASILAWGKIGRLDLSSHSD